MADNDRYDNAALTPKELSMLRGFARREAKKARRNATTGVKVYANQTDEDRAEARSRMVGRADKYEALAAKLDAMYEAAMTEDAPLDA